MWKTTQPKNSSAQLIDFTLELKIAASKSDGNLICETRCYFVFADRDHYRGNGDRRLIPFRRQRARLHNAASKPRDAQFHEQRQLLWRLAIACRRRTDFAWTGLASRQQEVDPYFPRHADGHDAGGCGGNRNQTLGSTGETVCAC